MAVTANKWMKKPVDKDKIIRNRLKIVLKESNTTWVELAKNHDTSPGALQRSIEAKLGAVNDFFMNYGYEIVIKPISKK